MKVTSVTISGMHKAQDKTYNLNPGTTYFVGPNGAGKSTILEAIQLALLGYIPGYAKTKEGVMKHASGKFMEVSITLDSGITIDRTWMRSGSGSVNSECNITGYDGEIIDLLKGIELPILDFNEFTSLTANKLKEWFISFLPSSEKKLNLTKMLKDELKGRQLPTDQLLDEIKIWVDNSSLTGVDLVKGLNAYLKEEQSFLKGQVSKLQGTIESLIYYDDAPVEDADELNEKLNQLNRDKTEILRMEAAHDSWDKMMTQIKLLEASLKGTSVEDDPEIKEANKQIQELVKQSDEAKAIYKTMNDSICDLQIELRNVPSASATCPYTQEVCETASKLAESSEAKRAELTEEIEDLRQKSQAYSPMETNKIDAQARQLQQQINQLETKYMQLKSLKDQAGPEPEVPEGRSVTAIDEEIRQIQDGLVKIAANKKYDELTQTVTSDKFAKENDLEALKVWIKFTDANGLQTQIMDEPFQDLSDDMSKYLTQMFGAETKAEFNLAAKANSFSFGLSRNNKYIEFDCLSSGEKCLFTLALMMCILDRSESDIRTILVDDLLDHLDGENAKSLFKSLQNIDTTQFILAGVKECEEPSICVEV